MLAGLALKRRWQQARRAAGQPTDRPNIVMGGNVQVVWEKFANYWEVEPRYVPLEGDVFHLTADRLLEHVDEHTIGVVAVLGSTMDGSYEPVQEICAALDAYQADTGVSVPVHVDAASGGFIAPFIQPGPGLGLPAGPGGVDPEPRVTSSAWSTRASGGSCGATPSSSPRTWSSTSTTWAGTCPPSP